MPSKGAITFKFQETEQDELVVPCPDLEDIDIKSLHLIAYFRSRAGVEKDEEFVPKEVEILSVDGF